MNERRNISGRRLSKLRSLKGYTQIQLAARVQFYGSDLDREKISKMEAGIRSIDDRDLWHLSLALEVSVQAFFEELKPVSCIGSFRRCL